MSASYTPFGFGINNGDLEKMVVLKTIDTVKTVASKNIFNQNLEDEIVLSLASDNTVVNIQDLTTSGVYLNSKSNSTSMNTTIISDSQKSQFDIVLPTGITDRSFAINSVYQQASINYDPTNITANSGTATRTINKIIDITQSPYSLYDSNLEFISALNTDDCYDDSSITGTGKPLTGSNYPTLGNSVFQASFDNSDSDVNIHRQLNSEFCTTDNSRPMYVQEDSSFNTLYAMGQDATKYVTLDSTTGAPSTTGLASANLLSTNKYSLVNTLANITSNDFGMYKITRDDSTISVSTLNGTTSTTATYFPIAGSGSNSSSLPSIPDIATLNTLIDINNNTILDGYEFKLQIDSTAGSGFAFSSDMASRSYTSTNDSQQIVALDDSGLVDNKAYMIDFASGSHSLQFNSASLSIEASTNGDATNISNYFSLNSVRETLGTGHTDGEVLLNKRSVSTRATITTNTTPALSTSIYYDGENTGADSGKTVISSDMATNPYVGYKAQLVIKNSTDSVGDFLKEGTNHSSLNLFDNGAIVNSNFNSSLFEFSSSNSPNSNDIELFKIMPSKQLSNVDDFVNSTGAAVPFVSSIVNLTNFKTLYSDSTPLDKAKILFTLPTLSQSTIYNDIVTNGWSIDNANVSGFMNSSSVSAFAADGITWPTLAETKQILETPATTMEYTMTFGTEHGITAADLQDFVTISYQLTSAAYNTVITIPQEMLTKHTVGTPSRNAGATINGWSLSSGTNPLTGKSLTLKQFVATRTLNYSFDLNLRGFTGLTVTTPSLTSTTTYYSVIDNAINKSLPTSYLKYIAGDYTAVTETLQLTSAIGISTSFTGTLSSDDFCHLNATVHAYEAGDVADVTISESKKVSAFYGIPISMSLLSSYKASSSLSGEISLELEAEYLNASGNEDNVTLNDSSGYSIQLNNDYTSNYQVSYYTTNSANLSTIIGNDTTKLMTVADGYSNVTWQTSTHRIDITYEQATKSTVVLSIKRNSDDATCYQIKTLNFSFPIVQMIISRISADAWRMVKTMGNDSAATPIETFMSVDYTNTLINLDLGVYLTSDGLSSSTIATVGSMIDFSLLADLISVNMVGSASTPLSAITNFTFTSTGSRTLSINRYRSFHGAQTVNQVYTLARDQLEAVFTSTSSDSSKTASQTFSNIYAGQEVTVDDLSSSYGSIGLKFTFSASMLASSDVGLNCPLYTRGDAVTITISNPNLTTGSGADATPITMNKSLKDSTLYTFSNGQSIFSTRLKLQSTTYSSADTSYTWKFGLTAGATKVYKVSTYTGNPASSDVDWGTFTHNESYATMIGNGLTIGNFVIKTDLNTNVNDSNTSYLVNSSPFLIFCQNIYSNTSVTFPYNPTLVTPTFKYEPMWHISVLNTYNPFASVSGANDVTFTFLGNKTYGEYSTIPDTNKKSFVVEGNTLTINLLLGLQTSSRNVIACLFGPSPANRLLDITQTVVETNDTINALALSKLSSDSYYKSQGINDSVKLLLSQSAQSLNIMSPYTSLSPNIEVVINSFFFINLTTQFDLRCGIQGQKLKLYTKKTQVNSSSGVVSFRVYKYESLLIANNEIDSVIPLLFSTRQYKDFVCPSISAVPVSTPATTTVPDWNNIVSNAFSAVPSDWTDDAVFNASSTTIRVDIPIYNDNVKSTIHNAFVKTDPNGYSASLFVTRDHIIDIRDKLQRPVHTVAWDGTVSAPLFAGKTISLHPNTSAHILDNLSNIHLVNTTLGLN